MTAIHGIISRIIGGTLATLLLLGLALPASATLRTIEQSYELTRVQVQLPTTPEGRLTVRLCQTCRPVILRVTPETAWSIRPGSGQPAGQAAGQAAVLAAFRAAATNQKTLVYVYYEAQTRHVKRIVLDPRAPEVQK